MRLRYAAKPLPTGQRSGMTSFQRESRTAEPAPSRAASHLTWAAGGFIVGAVFWHMVGFWGFVDRMLQEETERTSIVATAQTETKAPVNLQRDSTLQVQPVAYLTASGE